MESAYVQPPLSPINTNGDCLQSTEGSPLLDDSDTYTDGLEINVAVLPPAHGEDAVRPFKQRWYILAVFSSLSLIQAAVWNTWGPISQSAFQVFPSWTNSTIAMLSNWGNLTYVIFVVPLCWVMDVYGLRCALVVTGIIQLLGTGVRCISSEEEIATILIHVGQFLNGVGGIVVCSAPPLVSAIWFPPDERTTATAISTIMNSVGAALSFVVGPTIVKEASPPSNSSDPKALYNVSNSLADPAEIDRIRSEIMQLMYIEFIATAVVVLCILLHFPSKPALPPSMSATIQRYGFKDSFTGIIRNGAVWMVAISFALSMAVFGSWLSVMDLTLNGMGIDQLEAGWIGFYMVVTGCVGSLIIARLTDYIGGHMKLTIILGMTAHSILAVIFSLQYSKIVPHSSLYLYIVIISMGLFNSSLYSLYLELAVEISYPVDEGIVGGFLSGLWNIVATAFLLVFFIPDIGTIWMNYCLVGSAALSIPFMFLLKENYMRSDLDHHRMLLCR